MNKWEWLILGFCVGFDAGVALAQWIERNKPIEGVGVWVATSAGEITAE